LVLLLGLMTVDRCCCCDIATAVQDMLEGILVPQNREKDVSVAARAIDC
jgi:hypothetical protein